MRVIKASNAPVDFEIVDNIKDKVRWVRCDGGSRMLA